MKAYRWAKKQTGLTSAEKFVLVMLGDRYNDDWGRAWPSHARLADDTALSPSTVKRAIERLEELGLVVIERWRMNEGDVHMPNRYLLPAVQPETRPAYWQPVLAIAGWGDVSLMDFDELRRVPGSNLYIETDALNPEPSERDQGARSDSIWTEGSVHSEPGVGSW